MYFPFRNAISHSSFHLLPALALYLFVLMDAAIADEPLDSPTEAAQRPIYKLSWQGKPIDRDASHHNTEVTYLNGIPFRVRRWTASGGGTSSLSRWVDKGLNRLEFAGAHTDGMVISVEERNLVGIVPQLHREAAKLYLAPDEASKSVEFQADVSWSSLDADQLDVSKAGRRRAIREIRQILQEHQIALRREDKQAIQDLAGLFLPGIVRDFESSYEAEKYPKEKLPKAALEWAIKEIHPGTPESPYREELEFIFGTRGVLVYRGFNDTGHAYLYHYKSPEDEIHEAAPWVFLRVRGKWQVRVAELL